MENKANPKATLKVLGKVLLTAAAAGVIYFAGAVLSVVFASEGVHPAFTYIAGYALLALLLPLIWLKSRKAYARIWLALAAVCVVAVGVNVGLVKYDESIRINTSSTEYIYDVTAEDAFVFIVHKDNPVDGLTTEQLQGIFSGRITNWNEVGGENKKIKAYQCEADCANQTMMELFMGDVALMEPATEMGYGYLYAWEEMVSVYRNKPSAIGYCFTSYVRDNPDVKLLRVDGVAPTQENVRNGSYPIITPSSMIVVEEEE